MDFPFALPPVAPAWRRGLRIAGALIGGLLIAAFLLLSFGWGLLRGTVERQLGRSLDRRVQIGSLRRVGAVSLAPVLEVRDVRVGQPAWAGPGDMAAARSILIRLPLVPLLAGRLHPHMLAVDGLRLALVRAADGRANWRRTEAEQPHGSGSPVLGDVAVRDAAVTLDDRQLRRRFATRVTIDAQGLRLAGMGDIAGSPARVLITGAPVAQQAAWPFRARIASPLVSIEAEGRMATPLDLGHFTARITSRGHDLHDLDRLIEAGLPATQDYQLSAVIRHDRPAWFVDGLQGRIGRSELHGHLSVHKAGERTLLDGDLASSGLDFDDLTSDEGLARGRAEARVTGPRFFPSLRIDLAKLRRTDGTLRVRIDRLLFKEPSTFRTLSGSLTLDHGVLTAAPLVATLAHGQVKGSAVVHHQAGVPRLDLDLRLIGSRMENVLTLPDTATGALAGRMRLTGSGFTVRQAIGRSSGRAAIVSIGGAMNRRAALLAGADLGRALMSGKDQMTPVRCLIASFSVAGGTARPAPLVLDTAVGRADGGGSIDLATEQLHLTMTGRPKLKGGVALDAPATIAGVIKQPRVIPPPQVKDVGHVLKLIGRAIGGDQTPLAPPADCGALARTALR